MNLAALFTDGMVLQRDRTVVVWGWDKPGQEVTVTIGDASGAPTAGDDGRFVAELPAMPAGGPHTMRVAGTETLTVDDIMVGEVWLCSGQSNMQWSVDDSDDAEAEIAGADWPDIRLFHVPPLTSPDHATDVDTWWRRCSPKSVRPFSAVAYSFGRDIHRTQGVAVGLIFSAWGGTRAEAWTSEEKLMSIPRYAEMIEIFHASLVDFDAAWATYREKNATWERDNLPEDPGNGGFDMGWAGPEFDDSDWRTMETPGSWQSHGEGYSGVFWFRREIDVPDSLSGRDLLLSLGPLDKADETYFNGVKVGETTLDDPLSWSIPRRYEVPAGLVKPGRNVVATRIYSHMYAGGFLGHADELFLGLPDERKSHVPLDGAWRFHVEHDFGFVEVAGLSQPEMPIGPDNPNAPSILFRNMIHPLIGYGIRGTIWYQGESNVNQAAEYFDIFTALIADWRERWGYEFPFYFVQLANHVANSNWPVLRKQQKMALALPQTGMAVTIDVGMPYDIHPTNKRTVGERLSRIARHFVHSEDIEYSGPVAESAKADGSSCRVTFSHANGLRAKGDKVEGFELACADGEFLIADSAIDGDAVVVSADGIDTPKAVRYAWKDDPVCNLINGDDLPAGPFRMDVE